MTTENAVDKARRLLVEGRVIITAAGPGFARALVRGDGALYAVTDDARGRHCDCPARGLCAHVRAVGMVTAPRGAP
ncbi:MAG: hypothetical protein M3O32_05075 [Actinomycetota bacterium]|nr:hypothetical protein [Actinomycetota bacterium]